MDHAKWAILYIDSVMSPVLVQKIDGSVEIDYIVGSLDGSNLPDWKYFSPVRIMTNSGPAVCHASSVVKWRYICPTVPTGSVELELLYAYGGKVTIGSSDKVLVISQAEATTNGISMPPDFSCGGNSVLIWGDGCSAYGPKTPVGQSTTVTNQSLYKTGYEGSATFLCSNGNWKIQTEVCNMQATNVPTSTPTSVTTTETQNQVCPADQTGSIQQQRTVTTTNGVSSYGAWSTVSNNCSVTITNPSTSTCVDGTDPSGNKC